MTEQHFEGDDPNATDPPEEGDDQLVKEGTEVQVPEEGDLEDAPEPDPNAPDDPEDSEGDAA
jgi:hypothetical protein